MINFISELKNYDFSNVSQQEANNFIVKHGLRIGLTNLEIEACIPYILHS